MIMRHTSCGDKWDQPVLDALQEMLDRYYSEEHPPLNEVVSWFMANAIKERWQKYPLRAALENYVRQEETRQRLARRR